MREEIKKSIIGFIENKERVLCLNGAWGVGKTYLIDEIRAEYNKKEKHEIKYAKLFGLKGMNDLIVSLFFDSKGNFSRGFKHIASLINNILNSKLGFSVDLSVLSLIRDKVLEQYSAEKKLVIIVDDIERKEKELSIVEFFGFIDAFKEKIKFILVMNEEEIEEKEVYKKYKEKIIDRIITIDKPDVEIYHSILFGSVNIDNKNIDKLNKIGIFDNINLRTIKMFKNIIDLNNLDINNNDEENIYKLKMIYSILNFEYNNRYKKEDLIEKKLRNKDIDLLFYSTANYSNEKYGEKEKEYEKSIKEEVYKKSDIECFYEYFQDDVIFSLTSTEEFKRLTNEYINIVKTGLYEKLSNVKIEFLKKGKKQFFSERQIAFYSSTPQETAILYLNEIQNAIMNNEFSKVSILNNYIVGITQNYIKYYNNELAQKKMNEILNHLLPKVAKEIVEEKIYSIEIRNYALLCENKDVLNVIRNIENKLIEEVKKNITEYYENIEFNSIISIRKIFDNINDIDTILGWKLNYIMSDNLINHILEYIKNILSKDIDTSSWSGTYLIIEKLKNYDKKIVIRLKNIIDESNEPLKERLNIILNKIEKTI